MQQTSSRPESREANGFQRKRKKARRVIKKPEVSVVAMIAADLLSLSLAWIVCVLLLQLAGRPSPLAAGVEWLGSIPFALAVFGLNGLYPAFGMERTEETRRLALCMTGVYAGSVGAFALLHAPADLALTIAFGTLSMVCVPIGRVVIRDVMKKKGWWGRSVILINAGGRPKDLTELFVRCPQRGLFPTGVVCEIKHEVEVAPGVAAFDALESALHFAREQRIETAVVALGGSGTLCLSEASSTYARYFSNLIVVPRLPPDASPGGWTGTFGRFIDSEDNQELQTALSGVWKRLLDVLVALSAGVVLLPLILAVTAAVKLTSRGRIFYGHQRVGRNNTPFRVWKFRTMVEDADILLAERLATDRSLQIEWEQNHKLRNDPRLTPIGNFLRRYSIDELPQLWNVIKGEMSIVGPRPIVKAEIPKYAEYFEDYAKVLPGITGLWQVSGRNETSYQQRVHLDAYYVNHWSLLLDLNIILRTFKVVTSARGAY